MKQVIRSKRDAERFGDYVVDQVCRHPVEVSCDVFKPKRTDPQNNYLFGVCYPPIAKAMGYAAADIHEFMCGTHFGWVDKRVPKTPRNREGIASEPRRSTTRAGWQSGERDVLGKMEFAEFVDTVHRIAAQAGVFIAEGWNDVE